MKRICRYLPIFVLPLACLPLAHAQAGVDIAVGFGAAQDSAATTGLDPNTLLGCTLGKQPDRRGLLIHARPQRFHDGLFRRPDVLETFRH